MFGDYVYEQVSAQYIDRILLIDSDNLEEQTHYSSDFSAHGFDVLFYTDDLHFRIECQNRLESGGKLAVIAKPNDYVPYDIHRRLRSYNVSFARLFANLDAGMLRERKKLDLNLLCLAYQKNFNNLRNRKMTEQFIDGQVYEKQNVGNYLQELLNVSISEAIQAKSYTDWFSVAEKKAKIEVLAVAYSVPVDTEQINALFQKYILESFGKLSSCMDRNTPVLVSKTMEYMHDHSDKFAIIVMDGMSEFDWEIISSSFHGMVYHRTAAFAMIPTTTSISRQCLLSNKYPSQLVNPWSQSKEKMEFVECARGLGFADQQIEYGRGYDTEFASLVRCGAIIINDVDDMVHGQQQGRLGMYNDITVLANQSKLVEATKRLLKRGFDVYITADHGNAPCRGMGKLMGTGVEVETKSRRMIVLKDFADKEGLLAKVRLIDYPKYYLSKEYNYLICDTGDSFDAKGEDVMSHGGITIDEVVVPFIIVKAVDNNG